ncbi:hypothetical protein JCM24511_05816 [Saitozyma sp. JCM 24511]|nr:hypothetical protein JCM24511_05816 [Saitozyma sp. JCM 24511]
MSSFLVPGSPPRSPHGPPPPTTFLDSYFSSSAPFRPYWSIRPTRRDILLCLLTLSFSYLVFSSPPAASETAFVATTRIRPPTATAPSRIPNWSKLWGSKVEPDLSCSAEETLREETYGESVKTYGSSVVNLAALDVDVDSLGVGKSGATNKWGVEGEQAEDDELTGVTTSLKGHEAGWTLMDQVYVFNGSLYVVTDQRSDWPELLYMTSTGLPATSEPGNGEARRPKGHEIQFISPLEALALWGPRVYKMAGTTWLFNDGQFIDHYYHFSAELLLGTWRTYASLDREISAKGETSLPPPRRIWFLHQSTTEWRDRHGANPTVVFALFPSVSLLYPEDWADIGKQTMRGRPRAFMLERALLADRSAAFYGQYTIPTSRTVANALHVGTTTRWWWEPIRRQMLRYSGVHEDILDRNLEGLGAIDPATVNQPHMTGVDTDVNAGLGVSEVEPLATPGTYTPLVTYISRQSSRRRLTPESHADLVRHLEDRAKSVGFELVIVEAEKLSLEEQFALAGRTTIMLGVHGNGLTHLIWMPATPRSAVIEMFFVGGFARDYQWTAHALGIRHFGVNHDTTFTAPNIPDVAYPEGFQGESITVDGKTVADLIEDRLAGRV